MKALSKMLSQWGDKDRVGLMVTHVCGHLGLCPLAFETILTQIKISVTSALGLGYKLSDPTHNILLQHIHPGEGLGLGFLTLHSSSASC